MIINVSFRTTASQPTYDGDTSPCYPDSYALIERIKFLERELHDVKASYDQCSSRQSTATPPNPTCPTGFFYLPIARRCYKLITDPLTWEDSNEGVPALHPQLTWLPS